MANKIKKIVPKGFITGETKNKESLKAAEKLALKDVSIKRGENTPRGGTTAKHKNPTSTEKRDLSFLKQTYLLDDVEKLVLEQQKKRMLESGSIREAIIPYTPSSHQLEVHELLEKKRFGVVVFHRGAGKKLALTTPIPRLGSIEDETIKEGVVPLSEIKVGDILWGTQGETVVLETHPITNETIYRVRTQSGYIDACGDHLWKAARVRKIRHRKTFEQTGPKWEVVTTKTLVEWLNDKRDVVILPRAQPIDFSHKELPIDPYVLGLWLGMESQNRTKCYYRDFHIATTSGLVIDKVENEMIRHGLRPLVRKRHETGTYIVQTYQAFRRQKNHKPPCYFLNALSELGLLEDNTRIPDLYKYSSIEQRIALVQGMMDQRGHVLDRNKHTSTREIYISRYPSLAADIKEVLSSLGCLCTSYVTNAKRDVHPWHYTVFKAYKFKPFQNTARGDRVGPPSHRLQSRYNILKKVDVLDRKSDMRCITVDAYDGLFCASKEYIPTHNTWLAINELIKRAWSCDLPQGGKYIYVAPEKLQAKKIAWKELKYFLKDVPCNINETNLMITLPNNSTIELEGADNPDRIRGQHPHFVVLDEVAQMPRDTWYEAVFPALRAHNGGALFIGTPKGDNLFRELFDQAHNKTSWFAIKKTIYDTNVSTLEQINEIKDSMPPSKFEQEYMCCFEAASQGTFYSHLFDRQDKQLVGEVPYNPALPVITAWDLGTTDMTSIWFAQVDGSGTTRLIDYYENTMHDIHHYIQLVRNKPYVYDYHILPHDVTHVSWESGRSRLAIFKSHNMNIRVAKKYPIEEGISIAQTFLYTCKFDEMNCAIGVNHLKQYRAKQNRITGEFTSEPVHDVHSNAADAFRMLAIGIKNNIVESNYRNSYADSSYDWLNPSHTEHDVNNDALSYDIFKS